MHQAAGIFPIDHVMCWFSTITYATYVRRNQAMQASRAKKSDHSTAAQNNGTFSLRIPPPGPPGGSNHLSPLPAELQS